MSRRICPSRSIAATRRKNPSRSWRLIDSASAMSLAASGASLVRSTPRISSRLGMGYGYLLKGLSMIVLVALTDGARHQHRSVRQTVL
ncbi:hypothetical protein BLAT2472_10696 [Burkholderia latens]